MEVCGGVVVGCGGGVVVRGGVWRWCSGVWRCVSLLACVCVRGGGRGGGAVKSHETVDPGYECFHLQRLKTLSISSRPSHTLVGSD